MEIKHEGFCAHRLTNNPLEQAFANAWKREQSMGTLGWLLANDGCKVDYSQRDAQVAATVIQWLGSPVGREFVRSTMEDFNAKKLV